jgi:hypothetical protein
MSTYRSLISLCLILLPTTALAVAQAEERAALDTRWRAGAWADHSERLDVLARDDFMGFRRELQRVLATQTSEPAMEDRLLQQAALSLLAAPRGPEGRELLSQLSRLEPRAMTLLEDSGRQLPIPYADAGGAARAVLRAWDRFDARDASLSALAAGTDPLIVLGTGSGSVEDRRRGVELAFESAAPAQLMRQSAAVRSALPGNPELTGIATRIALRTTDTALARDVIRHGQGRAQLDLVLGLRASFTSNDATSLLRSAIQDEQIASAAILELGHLAQDSVAAHDELLARLSDPALGGTAAQALAADMTPQTLTALGVMLNGSRDDLATRRAILSLRLSGNATANAMLSEYAAATHAPLALRQEVASWIGQ